MAEVLFADGELSEVGLKQVRFMVVENTPEAAKAREKVAQGLAGLLYEKEFPGSQLGKVRADFSKLGYKPDVDNLLIFRSKLFVLKIRQDRTGGEELYVLFSAIIDIITEDEITREERFKNFKKFFDMFLNYMT